MFDQILKEVTTHLSLKLLFTLAMHHPTIVTLSWCLIKFSRRYIYCSLWQCIIQRALLLTMTGTFIDVWLNSQGGDYSFINTTIVHPGNASSNGWHFVVMFDQILKEVQLLFALAMHHPTTGTLSWCLIKFSRRWLLIYRYNYCSLWQCIIQRLALCRDVWPNSQGGDYSLIDTAIVNPGNASSIQWLALYRDISLIKFSRRWLLINRYNYSLPCQ
jgi:hypothetical protein